MMQRREFLFSLATAAAVAPLAGAAARSDDLGVTVRRRRRDPGSDIDITVDGKPFTSLISSIRSLSIGKPIFWPIHTAKGTVITRGYPLVTHIPGEQTDHPHHVGLSFTYGAMTVDGRRMSTWSGGGRRDRIRPVEIKQVESGPDIGVLETVSLWETSEMGPVLEQTQKNLFRHDDNSRAIDFDITLKGLKNTVVFEDSKEGSIGIRVHHEITEKFTPGSDSTYRDERGNGEYVNAEGLVTEQHVWGKRSDWVALRGKVSAEPVVIALMFHPRSHNSPPYWHARGYGAFYVNPLGGRAAYTNGSEPPSTTVIEPGQSIALKYRFLVYSGELSKEELDQQYDLYLKQTQ